MKKFLRRLAVVAMVAGLFPCGGVLRAADDIHIALLTHDSLTSTMRTLHAARKVIKRQHQQVTFHHFLVRDDVHDNLAIADSINRVKPNVIVTVGSSATEFAQTNFPDVPVVFSAVMYPVMSGFVESLHKPGANITGSSLNIPVDVQFKYFKKIVPDLKDIGVLYTVNTASLIPSAKVVAKMAGLNLVALEVKDVKDLPAALDSLATTVDGIWGVADPTLFDPRSTRYILLNTLRKGIPFMGFSRHVVESGALFALDFDYKAIGLQAGAIANRVLGGESPGRIPVTLADVLWFHYNEKTAHHINVKIPEELVAVAKEVYR